MKVKVILIMMISLFVLATASDAKGKAKIGLEIGNQAPNFKLLSPDGKVIELASLKGQMVLIDFWASWCGPCRRENPHVVEAYKKFKDNKFKEGKGFTVLSVSLDKNKNSWTKAIKADELIWPYHVSDLLGWNSQAAKIYGIRSIPDNYLINGDGIIVAKRLRGANLEAMLDKLSK